MNKKLVKLVIISLIISLIIGVSGCKTHKEKQSFINYTRGASQNGDLNSPSWDAALLAMNAGGAERRRSWGEPPCKGPIYLEAIDHPIDLNKMKLNLFKCKLGERYYPTTGDKTAGDWEPVIRNGNSFSWDTALLNISIGGYSRRRSWKDPGYYIYDPDFNHHPIDLNHMKLYSCDQDQCDKPDRYYPSEGDKTAGDWLPTGGNK